MKTIRELNEYFDDFLYYNKKLPNVITYESNMEVTNAIETQNLQPWKWGDNGSWIDYWCTFANRIGNTFCMALIPWSCPNISPLYASLDYLKHRGSIVGAHVKVKINGFERHGVYIIPICSACNGKHGQILRNLPLGIKLVEMINPHK